MRGDLFNLCGRSSDAARSPDGPMDRIIGATALVEGLKPVTADEKIRKSNVVS